ncbi:MAG: hypothetical protein ACUVX9_07250 [Anaerolineae bacterium]
MGRELICLDEREDHSVQRIAERSIHYLVWADTVPVPVRLQQGALRTEKVCGFSVLSLPAGK